jgi:hypothetical protein
VTDDQQPDAAAAALRQAAAAGLLAAEHLARAVASAKQQVRGSVRNSGAVTRRDAVGYGQHFWRPA